MTLCHMFIAVSSIKKKDLAEVRSMANPPAPVKLALESVCELLNVGASDWKAIRGIIVKDNFITSIVKLETDKITYDPLFYLKKIRISLEIQNLTINI